jgi:Type I restriction enzyme R protein N terminus (HSDR_N)
MTFTKSQINMMGEADVRAEIVDPIIARLGYRFNDTNFVERERTLRYPFGYVGHKSKRDVPLGAADYICGVFGRRGSFAIEAKKGDYEISLADIEQAHSYAAHPEVRADYFVVTNGHEFRIFETMRAIADAEIVTISNSRLVDDFYKIEALLSPRSLIRNCNHQYDLEKPLGDGLGSTLRIVGGWITAANIEGRFAGDPNDPVRKMIEATPGFKNIHGEFEKLVNARQPVLSGLIKRNSDEQLSALVKFGSSRPESEYNMAALNIQEMTFVSESSALESDVPIIFETLGTESVPAGTKLFPGIEKELAATPFHVDLRFNFRALGTMAGGLFSGEYGAYAVYQLRHPDVRIPEFISTYDGTFRIETALTS